MSEFPVAWQAGLQGGLLIGLAAALFFGLTGRIAGISGLLAGALRVGAPESPVYLRAAAAVQKLLAPSEMGELFKVLALARSTAIAWPGFDVADRRHRL